MYYEEFGDRKNPTIIFLHGAMAFHSFARQQELADSFNLIFYTFPGHGQDYGRNFDRSLAMEEIIRLIDLAGKEKAHIVGFSLGAQIALSLLDRHPERLDSVTLVSPLVDSGNTDELKLAFSTRIVGYATKITPFAKYVSKLIGVDDGSFTQFERAQKHQDVNRLSSQILSDMLKSEDLLNIPNVSNRVLILAGETETPSFVNSAKKLSKIIKNSELEIYKGAAHNIPYKFYRQFNARLRRFIGEDNYKTAYIKWRDKLGFSEMPEKKARESFSGELSFGTAGLRGIMGIGTNRMNEYVIARAAKGIASVVCDMGGGSIAISFDSRINSENFARISASVFVRHGLKVYLTESPSPTPLLSFAVRKLNCAAGVMVTASHNPKEYNGYKVYDGSGCQVSGGFADRVWEVIKSLDYFDTEKIDFDCALKNNDIKYIESGIYDEYMQKVKEQGFSSCNNISVCYTPLNGCGGSYTPKILEEKGASVTFVSEQSYPDGNFTTCPYPNPEKREALLLAVKYAHDADCDIILANDPDADRIGAMYKSGGSYIMLSGDEIGLLLSSYLLKKRAESGKLLKNSIIVRSIVTMPLVDKIAKKYRVRTEETLTGFKNICAPARKLHEEGKGEMFICGYEESNGFACGTYAFDKDGICAAMLLCELASELAAEGKNYGDALSDIYAKFGEMRSALWTLRIDGIGGAERIVKIMNKFRAEKPVPEGMRLFKITDFSQGEGGLPNSDVLRFDFDDGSRISLRPSGTEPLLKFYYAATGENSADTLEKLIEFTKNIAEKV